MMQGLKFFSQTSCQGSWNIASWHSPHSLTWRWLLGFSLFRADERRVWPIWMPYRSNAGLQWIVRIPFIGFLTFSQQRPIWYRDLHARHRDERDGLSLPTHQHFPPPPANVAGSHLVH